MLTLLCVSTAVTALPSGPQAYNSDHFVWKDKWAVAMSAPKWVLDTSLSVDPSTQTLTKIKKSYQPHFEGWLGMRPGVIAKDNVRVENNQLKLTVKHDDEFDFAAAQAADSGNDNGCSSCEYQKYTTGLIRSKAGLKHGFVEVKMQIPDASVVGNIWLQGANTEISVAEISSSDADRSIATAGYIFDAAAQVTSLATNVTTASAFPADAHQRAVTYGMEWRRNGDVLVYVDGVKIHKLRAVDWNPDGLHDEELRLVIDLSLNVPKYGDPGLDAKQAVDAVIDYIAVWKLECTGAITVTENAGKARPQTKLLGCTNAEPYKHFCVVEDTWRTEAQPDRYKACTTPEGSIGGAGSLLKPADLICSAITKNAFCTGKKRYGVGGGHDHCGWFGTATNQNKCQSTETDCTAFTDSRNCGGAWDSGKLGSHGKCMMCNDMCVNKSPDNQCGYLCPTFTVEDECTGNCKWKIKKGEGVCIATKPQCGAYLTTTECATGWKGAKFCGWDNTKDKCVLKRLLPADNGNNRMVAGEGAKEGSEGAKEGTVGAVDEEEDAEDAVKGKNGKTETEPKSSKSNKKNSGTNAQLSAVAGLGGSQHTAAAAGGIAGAAAVVVAVGALIAYNRNKNKNAVQVQDVTESTPLVL